MLPLLRGMKRQIRGGSGAVHVTRGAMSADVIRAEFDARLQRITAGTGHTKSAIFVGQDEVYRYVPRVQPRRKPAQGVFRSIAYSLSVLLAFGLGLSGGLLGLFARFHLAAGLGQDLTPAYQLLVNTLTGFVIACCLTTLLRLRGSEQLTVKLTGVVVALCTHHNLVHQYPEEFARAFSQVWVQSVISLNPVQSIMILGAVVPL